MENRKRSTLDACYQVSKHYDYIGKMGFFKLVKDNTNQDMFCLKTANKFYNENCN